MTEVHKEPVTKKDVIQMSAVVSALLAALIFLGDRVFMSRTEGVVLQQQSGETTKILREMQAERIAVAAFMAELQANQKNLIETTRIMFEEIKELRKKP